MSASYDRWADAAGAYVLGAMAPDERDEFEGHLATCAACRQDVEELRPAAAALPMASPPMLPPAALKDRIMAEVEREATLLAQTGAGADRPEPAPRRRRRFAPSLSAWRLAPVAAALLIAGVLIGSQLGGGTKEIGFNRAGAMLKVKDGQATLVADHLPAPPQGKVYEVWVVPKGAATPKPTNVLFTPRGNGAAEAAIPGDVSDIGSVLVSDEPPGGSEKPTGHVLMQADVS
jgi:anti-sigma-K factor RskA